MDGRGKARPTRRSPRTAMKTTWVMIPPRPKRRRKLPLPSQTRHRLLIGIPIPTRGPHQHRQPRHRFTPWRPARRTSRLHPTLPTDTGFPCITRSRPTPWPTHPHHYPHLYTSPVNPSSLPHIVRLKSLRYLAPLRTQLVKVLRRMLEPTPLKDTSFDPQRRLAHWLLGAEGASA